LVPVKGYFRFSTIVALLISLEREWHKQNNASNTGEGRIALKALVITPNEKTVDLGSLLAIARSEGL
jgi:hypothetical protein